MAPTHFGWTISPIPTKRDGPNRGHLLVGPNLGRKGREEPLGSTQGTCWTRVLSEPYSGRCSDSCSSISKYSSISFRTAR